jgi:integrase
MELSSRRLLSSTGERFVVLVNDRGMPLFYPTLYITVHLRGRSLAVNTIQNALSAIKAIYAWQTYYNVNIESRLSRKEVLQVHEIHSIRDFMQKSLRGVSATSIASIAKSASGTVSVHSQYARMSVIADYIAFLSSQFHSSSHQKDDRNALMIRQIRASRPKISNKSSVSRDEKYLDDTILDELERVLKPGSANNPVREHAVQVRNALMFSILRIVGLRRGELLNLRVEDIDFMKNSLAVIRRPDSTGDVRAYQPVAKTRERVIPLIPELVDSIRYYVLTHRNKVPGAKKHGYLFVTHKSGPSQGLPLSNAGFGKFISNLKCIFKISSGIHAHSLRHHWNYTFSKLCDDKNISPEREEKIRSYLMGWSQTSGTAATYNRRHIKEQAVQAVLEIQGKHFNKIKSRT